MNIYCFSTLSFAKLQFKSVINKAFHKHGVASFTDAWIETYSLNVIIYWFIVASFTDAWIETVIVTENKEGGGRRIFYRCVDWNPDESQLMILFNVASFTDAWIETVSVRATAPDGSVASFTDAWIETSTRMNLR